MVQLSCTRNSWWKNIIVAFPLAQGISCVKVNKETVYFNICGSPAQHGQFPLQMHLLWLCILHSTVSIDEFMFATGQAYELFSIMGIIKYYIIWCICN